MAENHEKILFMLGELVSETKGINNRLDRMNGNIAKHDNKIAEIDNWRSNIRGKVAIISFLVSFFATIIVPLILEHLL